jgi:hypothetical protein
VIVSENIYIVLLHNKEHHNLYTSPNIMVITSKRIRWTRHVTQMGGMRNAYKLLTENLKGRDYSEDLGTVGQY